MSRPPATHELLAPRLRVRGIDMLSLALLGLRVRPARTALSATGIAIAIATVVSVLGISASSRAQLIAQIDALGTNLLTVTTGQSLGGTTSTLPPSAPAMLARIGPVRAASAIGDVNADVYRSDRISAVNTEAITVYAAGTSLLSTLEGRLDRGRFLTAATDRLTAVVLGADAATALGVDRADGSIQVWLGGQWFAVTGILDRVPLAPELDRSALIGFPIARHLLHASGDPVEVYVRGDPASVAAVQAVIPATADPAAPQNVTVTNPTDALTARADATTALQSLFLALGGIALLVGGIGIANVMFIAVLERRSEIGLRRALGATPADIAAQFTTEAAMLALGGGVLGAVLGAIATAAYAATRGWRATVPLRDLFAATLIAAVIGMAAGAYPARKAAHLAPSEALRTT